MSEYLAARIATTIAHHPTESAATLAEKIIADLGLQEETWSVLPAGHSIGDATIWARRYTTEWIEDTE